MRVQLRRGQRQMVGVELRMRLLLSRLAGLLLRRLLLPLLLLL